MIRAYFLDQNGIQTGDILLVKNYSIIGWLIGNAFRADSLIAWHGKAKKRPSGHNGIIGRHKGELVVFEAQPKGFIATPFKDYLRRVQEGQCEIKLARLPGGLSDYDKQQINDWCSLKIGTPYDYRAYVSLIWRSMLRLRCILAVQDESHFYCTEAVKVAYAYIGKKLFKIKFSSPFTVEKRISQGRLIIIAEYWNE